MRLCLRLANAVVGFSLVSVITGPMMGQRRDIEMGKVAFYGRVLEEDGSPPSDLVQVNFVCNGRIKQQTLTDLHGTFAFDLDPDMNEAWLDPGTGGSVVGRIEGTAKVAPPTRAARTDEVPSMGLGRVSLSGCEVKLSPEAGQNSNSISLGTVGSLENPNIGIITIYRLSDSRATVVSLSTLGAPRKAREAFEKAQTELARSSPNLGKARKELEKAIREYPEFSAAWDLSARVHLMQGNSEEGRSCFLRAVDVEPKFTAPYHGLAQMAFQAGDWNETFSWTTRLLELDAQNVQGLYWKGLAGFYLKNFDEAEKALSSLYREAKAEDYPFGLLPLGVIHANQGRIRDAAGELHLYLRLMPTEQVPDAQRAELKKQLESWQAEGLISLPAKQP